MIKPYNVVVFFLCSWAFTIVIVEADTDYYWRDYNNGEIPPDAIPGGRDKNGATTFIGAAVHPQGKGIIPANIYPKLYALSHAKLQGVSNEVHMHLKYVKILCSQHLMRYEWVQMRIDNFNVTDGIVVKGGRELDEDLYIGRVSYKNELKVGKVFPPGTEQKGLWVPGDYYTGEMQHFNEFELLVYKPPCNLCWDT